MAKHEKPEDVDVQMGEAKAIDHLAAKSREQADEVMAGVDSRAVQSGTNAEVGAADSFVGSEKVSPSARNANRHAVVQNKTYSGMPSDVHQVLVAGANHLASHAALHSEVSAVLEKYAGSDELAPDVRGHLEGIKHNMAPLAKAHAHARVLLEKNV